MIDTEALRKKVIDLAIRGKLTEQLPEDGTAEKLYAQIQEEKAKLVKERKIKKEKPFPAIETDEIPFEIPKNWKWVRLGELTEIERGGSPRPIKAFLTDSEDGINWIKIGDVEKDGKYIIKTKERIIPEGTKKSRMVFPGDFLLTNSMSYGRPYISKIKGCIHDGWLLIRNTYTVLDLEYLYIMLSSGYAYNQFSQKASGSTVNNLNIDKVNLALIPLPPLTVQKRIAAKVISLIPILDRIDALQSQYLNNLESLKSKIIDAGIRGKLTEQLPTDGTAEELYAQILEEKARLVKERKIKKEKPLPAIEEDEIPFEIPKNWKWVRLAELGRFSGGKTPSMANKSFWTNGAVLWVTSKDMKQKNITSSEMTISESAAKAMTVYPKQTVLFVVRSGILRRLFPVAVLKTKSTINQDLKALQLYVPEMCEYVYYLLKAFEPTILFKYTKEGTTVNNIVFDALLTMPIPLPPFAEQKRIADKIDEVLQVIQ